MKIGFFTDGYLPEPNGVAENVATSAKALENLGHIVYIVAPKHPNFTDKNPRIFRLRSVRVYKNPEFRMAVPVPERDFREASKIDFDIIHGHAGGPVAFLGFEIARRKNIPYVFTYHTLWNRYTHYILKGKILTPKMMEVASRVFCNLCSAIIAPTQRVKKELESYSVRKPIYVIPGGIEISRFKNTKKGFLRNKFNILDQDKILLYVGRLGKEKSVDFLIESFQQITKEIKNVKLVIVGDGPERNNLEKLTKKLSLKKEVVFAGFIGREDIPRVYADADLFVFASTTETQGLVVSEALASGVPCVVIDDPAFEGIVAKRYNGLVTKNTVEDFSTQVIRLLKDMKLISKFSENSKNFASTNLTAKKQAEELIKVYRSAIQLNKLKKTQTQILKERFSTIKNFLNINQKLASFKQVFIKGLEIK